MNLHTYFTEIEKQTPYEGTATDNPLAFQYYDRQRPVLRSGRQEMLENIVNAYVVG
jgi:xylose isomerase